MALIISKDNSIKFDEKDKFQIDLQLMIFRISGCKANSFGSIGIQIFKFSRA